MNLVTHLGSKTTQCHDAPICVTCLCCQGMAYYGCQSDSLMIHAKHNVTSCAQTWVIDQNNTAMSLLKMTLL